MDHTELNLIHETPVLEETTSKGNKKFWKGFVGTDAQGRAYKFSSYWQETAGGKSSVQYSSPTLVERKNVGKTNETQPVEQAIAEVESQAKRQRDKGYHEFGEETDMLMLPMLAKSWKDAGHRVEPPFFVQPKYDGCRALYGPDGAMWSRKAKPYIPEVYAHLKFDTNGLIVDGEMMLPRDTGASFQDTMKAIKKFRSPHDKDYRPGGPLSADLVYIIYDAFDPEAPDMPFSERFRRLQALAQQIQMPQAIVVAPTYTVKNEAGIWEAHREFVELQYEGTMVRTDGGAYTPGKRSVDLLKHKDFVEDDFEVIAVGDGKGKFQGLAMFSCKTSAGLTFDCSIAKPDSVRRQMFLNGPRYVGKMLTVKYQELTDDGIPRFPVGIRFRDEEEK